MAVLRITVDCFSCMKTVDKRQARLVKGVTKDPRYECFGCFQKNKTMAWGFGDELKQKTSFYCQRCKYKFRAIKECCPYCNKIDFVTRGDLTVHDLL